MYVQPFSNKMGDQNPLNICLPTQSALSSGKISNKSGRPTVKNMIKFSPQPKSIIAQMLSERAPPKNDVHEVVCLDQSEDSVDEESDDYYLCSICSHRCSSAEEHKKHLTEHKQFSCDYPNCTYSCKLSSNLLKHKRVHTNEKPYLCEKCCFRSNFVNSLKAHKRTHTDERPYQCIHCTYKCNSSSNLKKHYRHKHPESNCHCDKI